MSSGRLGKDHEPARVMFLFWGRRGSMSRFTLDIGRAALADPSIRATISVSRQNEIFSSFAEFGDALFPIDTFSSNLGAVAQAWRLPLLRRKMVDRLRQDRIQAVVTLMPHVWTPLVAPVIRQAGVRYITIIHDADGHPGDPTSLVHSWGMRDVIHADLVLTLSSAVAGRLEATGRVPFNKLFPLFHPDLHYGPPTKAAPPKPGEPFRLLFLGRILPYKGLPLLLDAVELLKQAGLPIELGVFGEGALGSSAERLAAMGAEVVNSWLTDEEIGKVLPRYHAIVLSHVEASQSGVAATALGSGLPVVSTPVGGLSEQVQHGKTGILANQADGHSLAEAIKLLYDNPELYQTICSNIEAAKEQRSMPRFLADLISHALYAGVDNPRR